MYKFKIGDRVYLGDQPGLSGEILHLATFDEDTKQITLKKDNNDPWYEIRWDRGFYLRENDRIERLKRPRIVVESEDDIELCDGHIDARLHALFVIWLYINHGDIFQKGWKKITKHADFLK